MAEMKIDISDVVNGAIEKIRQEGYTVQRWIPCSERLPEHDGDTLVVCREEYVDGTEDSYVCVAMYRQARCGQQSGWAMIEIEGEVTHWMPLPDPPEKDSDAG